MSYLMGIDYGTGGAKATIIDEQGSVLGYSFAEYEIINEKADWSEHDPREYWEVACKIIQEAINDAGINPGEIKGIGTSSALPSTVLIDEEGEPINRAYNLLDRRATKEVEYLEDKFGKDRIFEITANRLDDQPAVVKLLWEKRNRPEDFARIDKVLTIDGYIRYKLTGKATMHYSAGIFYGLAYDIRQLRFRNDMLEEIGIDPEIFPPGSPCTEIVGKVTEKAAKETGLVSGIPVPGGQVDCNAAWLGAGATQPGDIQMNLGTCGNFGIIHNDEQFMEKMFAFPYTTNSRETYITVPTTLTGGLLLRYMRDNFSPIELSVEKKLDLDAYDLLTLEASEVKPGSEGLIVLPYFQGERTPIWDVNARGVIFGLSLSHGKKHVVRAMMESVAYALYDSFRLVKDIREINYPLVLNEGGAESRLWRQIITDVFNVPTVLVKNRVGAPYGDAVLAGVATDIFPDFSVTRDWVEYTGHLEPDQKNHKLYMEYFKVYKNIYEHVKEDFVDLAELRKISSDL